MAKRSAQKQNCLPTRILGTKFAVSPPLILHCKQLSYCCINFILINPPKRLTCFSSPAAIPCGSTYMNPQKGGLVFYTMCKKIQKGIVSQFPVLVFCFPTCSIDIIQYRLVFHVSAKQTQCTANGHIQFSFSQSI